MKNSFKNKARQGQVDSRNVNGHDLHCSKIMIQQTRYKDGVLSRYNQQDAKAVDNPFESVMNLSKMQSSTTYDEKNEMKSKPSRSLLECMLYITTCTLPDIAYVVTQM